jgi:hypothetical protein
MIDVQHRKSQNHAGISPKEALVKQREILYEMLMQPDCPSEG